MKFAGTKKWFVGVFAGTLVALSGTILAGMAIFFAGTQKVAEKLVPASGIDFTESTEMLANPFIGYPKISWFMLPKNGGNAANPSGFTWFYVNLKQFSGENAAPLSDEALATFAGTLENLRKNGGSGFMRFVYDWDGKRDCEPADFELVLTHLRQLCAVASRFPDVINAFECGLIGPWGEMHNSRYNGAKFANQIIDCYLQNTPKSMVVLVRTPWRISDFLGVPAKDLPKIDERSREKIARLGMFNDGYMNSPSDLGTWRERKTEIEFLAQQSEHLPCGGEFGSAFSPQFLPNSACVPENAIPEMYRTHLNYIRGNVYKIGGGNKVFGYDQFLYSRELETPDFPDNSAFYGRDCHNFITAHIGYRIVLRRSEISAGMHVGGKLRLAGTLENTGFANVLHAPKTEIILREKSVPANIFVVPADFDLRAAKSCQKLDYDFSVELPKSVPAGDYEVFLRFFHVNLDEKTKAKSAIRFANNGKIFDAELGGNKIGEIKISR